MPITVVTSTARSSASSAMPRTKERSILSTSKGRRVSTDRLGIAGAEIVHGEAHAGGAKRLHLVGDVVGVGHDQGFGDLELELRRLDAVLGQGLAAPGPESPGGRTAARETLTDRRGNRPCSAQRAAWAQTRRSTKVPISRIRPDLLGERDELGRRDEAAARVVPADQRLGADARAPSAQATCGW